MQNILKKWLGWGDQESETHLPDNEKGEFVLKIDGLEIGKLSFDKGYWTFSYTNEFKTNKEKYNLIVGFSDLDKTYKSHSLWPFFVTRIPGLKQPSVQKIIREEHIDSENEVALLKRFGEKSIANPYELIY